MGRNKAVAPDQIPIEAWRCLEDEGVKWPTCLFNKIFLSVKMLDEWRLSEVMPIYKNKGDAQACSNCRGIKLLSHTMKIWERVIERRLRMETRGKTKRFAYGFSRPGKAYDSIPRELVWRTLRDKGTPRRYSRVIKDMYEGVKTRIRTIMGNTEFFPVDVGLHQGSAISPYLFTLILDELSWEIQESIPWCMIFADDIMLIAETKLRGGGRLYMTMAYGDRILQPKESFRYLGSVIHRSGSGKIENVEVDVRLRWFRHVKRRPQNAPVRRVEAMLVEGSRRRGRPKLRWEDRLK
ncbi:retrovirus-related pol polyprotein LINE-1 [Tanacetum coccineum]